MMLCKSKKILLLFNPKVGSQSMRQLMNYLNSTNSIFTIPERGLHNYRLGLFPMVFPGEDLMGYRIFAFYRDPIERFLSLFEQHQTLNPETFPRGMSVAEYVAASGGFFPQKDFISSEVYTVELFNFEDFANEVVRMAAEFGYTIRANQVPKINESVNRKQRSDLTAEEIQLIKDLYAVDYQFLQSRGIIFS